MGIDLWEVTVTYEVLNLNGSTNSPPSDTGSSEITFQWLARRVSYERDRDCWGNPKTNSALEPFDRTEPVEETQWGFRIKRWEDSFNVNTASAYADHINSETWNLFTATPMAFSVDAGKAKCEVFIPEAELVPSETTRIQITYEFWYRWDGWSSRNLDSGYRVRLDAGIYEIINPQTNTRYSKQYLLDGKGDYFDNRASSTGKGTPTGAVIEYAPTLPTAANINTASAVYLRYQEYIGADFNELGF
jgi:hypothetical protein